MHGGRIWWVGGEPEDLPELASSDEEDDPPGEMKGEGEDSDWDDEFREKMLKGFCQTVNEGGIRRNVEDLENIKYNNPREEQLIKALIAREMERRESVRRWMAHPGWGGDPRTLGEEPRTTERGQVHGDWITEEPTWGRTA